jgi:hypothetical protein
VSSNTLNIARPPSRGDVDFNKIEMFVFDGLVLDEEDTPVLDDLGNPIIDWDDDPVIYAVRPITFKENKKLKKAFNGLEPRQVVTIVEQYKKFHFLASLDRFPISYDQDNDITTTLLDVYLGRVEATEEIDQVYLKGKRSEDPAHDEMIFNSTKVYYHPVTNTIEDVGMIGVVSEVRLGMPPQEAMETLIVNILKLGGRVVSIDKDGTPGIELVTVEEVEEDLPPDFLNFLVVATDNFTDEEDPDIKITVDITQGILTAAGVILPLTKEQIAEQNKKKEDAGKVEGNDVSKEQEPEPVTKKPRQRRKSS